MSKLSRFEKDFLTNYYKACHTSDAQDWFNAALAAKRMFNESRPNGNRDQCAEENAIGKDAQKLWS